MNIKIHSSELNRMMKTIVQCIDPKSQTYGNIEIIYDNNLLTIRGTNGSFAAVMSTPLLGGDGEVFHVDGTMFARVCAMCNGEITILTDDKVCTVKGAGRTRLPIVDVKIPAYEPISGKTCSVKAEHFSNGYNSVSYAISSDQNRIQLTGVHLNSDGNRFEMVALDGFKMAVEPIECESEEMHVTVPGSFMKLVALSTGAGDDIVLQTNGKRIQASTDGMMLSCSLLAGEFPEYSKVTPKEFKTESVTIGEYLQNALKSGSVVNTSNNLVKISVATNDITVMSNSEHADFDAEVNCITTGDGLKIAFNHTYLSETIKSIRENEIVLKFNSPISPCVIQGKDCDGFRLLLPVRVAG